MDILLSATGLSGGTWVESRLYCALSSGGFALNVPTSSENMPMCINKSPRPMQPSREQDQ